MRRPRSTRKTRFRAADPLCSRPVLNGIALLTASTSSSLKRDGVVNVSLVIFCQSFQGLTFGGIALFLPLIRQDLHMSFSQGGLLSAKR